MTSVGVALLSSQAAVRSLPRRIQRRQKHVSSTVLYESTKMVTWRDSTVSKVRNLRWLSTGWDGPDSRPISPTAIDMAIGIVGALAEDMPNLTGPTVVPTPYFGVYIEWYSRTCTIAFTINEDSTVEVDYEDQDNGLKWEGDLEDTPYDELYRLLSTYNRSGKFRA